MFIINYSGESETDSLMSEDDTAGKKEEMKKSIFMKRKSNDNLSLSPRGHEDTKKKSEPNKKKTSGSVSPRTGEDKKSPERKNPFSFTHAKKATNDIIQNEILKNEILKRKTEELNQKNMSSLLVSIYSSISPDRFWLIMSGQAKQVRLLQLYVGEQQQQQLRVEWGGVWLRDTRSLPAQGVVPSGPHQAHLHLLLRQQPDAGPVKVKAETNAQRKYLFTFRTSSGVTLREMRIEADPSDFK